ncbi:MAG: anhydro-N-acetylmuramic acid kinase [Bacteroidetes bacterium]|nr:anhydro-N-acetylmuramic acid kinase [Bacteroidota bacterium]
MTTYRVLGLMSGSSMDGLDIAYCILSVDEEGNWSYKIEKAECLEYPRKWHLRLANLTMQNAITYIKTHTYFGHYTGELVNAFLAKHGLEGQVDFIASHGQTIFHQPENKLTSQIGDGAAIAAVTNLPVVSNFRTTDVALGGQGAPIVPIGDMLLFPAFRFCLNLGGIANLTVNLGGGKMAGYDLAAANLVLNKLVEPLGVDFDNGGANARAGHVDTRLLEELDRSWYYKKEPPKTLGGGWVRKVLMPTFRHYRISTEDKLRTYVEHLVGQIHRDIAQCCEDYQLGDPADQKVLVTGGGVFNDFLLERLKDTADAEIIVPDETLIKFKEALIMGLIGCLRWRNETNILSSVTGATRDSIGGEIYA